MQLDYIDEIRQVLQWLMDDTGFREFFFHEPEAAIDELAQAGFVLSERARRHFLGRGRVTEANFDQEYWRFFSDLIERGESRPLPSRPLPRPRLEATPPPPPPPPKAANGQDTAEKAPERIVSTGFASETQPAQPLDANVTLATDSAYYYWFEVGERVEGSIEVVATELPIDKLPPEARLQVALFAFPGELEITPGKDVGEIKITPEGAVVVARPVTEPDSLSGDQLLSRRLFFPVRTPGQPGAQRLRCNIYYQQTLVQSRLVTVQVTDESTSLPQALQAEADYTLSRTLDSHQLEGMGVNLLSIMLNDNGDGTHGFRFFGQNEFKNDASFGEGELQDLIRSARGAMRIAAWGDDQEYDGKPYLYAGPLDEGKLRSDLVRFAIRGYRFYDALINRLAGDTDKAWDLADLMIKPGQMQIASKETARLVIPVAMFYDYPLDDGLPTANYSLCPSFLEALKKKQPLEGIACFQGNCPTHSNDQIVCPSGFWGYRHALGLPVSVSAAPDAPSTIAAAGVPGLAVTVSTDPNFKERPEHEQRLKAMNLGWEYADSRDATLEMMKATRSQIVYFYCHGGLSDNLPYLSVGPPGGPRLTRSNLRNDRIRWHEPRPLVFINGCHTTALSPEMALDLVSGFVEVAHAAGVIGTEITIYEPIAVAFGEECLRRFLVERQTIGEAVRGARLKMLQEGNPLGLVYIPYVMPGLRLA